MRVFALALLFLSSVVASTDARSYHRYHVLSTKASSEDQLSVLRNLQNLYDSQVVFLREPSTVLSSELAVSHERKRSVVRTLRKAGLPVTVLSSDLQADIDAERREPANNVKRSIPSSRSVGATFQPDHTFYRNFSQINELVENFEKNYPELVTVKTLPYKTHENRTVHYFEVGTHTDANGNVDKPVILLEVMVHAREWIGPAATLYAIDRLLQGFRAREQRMVDALTDFTWVVIPVTNPDGFVYTWDSNRLWRKNRRPVQQGTGCVGVDVNRNFDIKFGGVGAPSNCHSWGYPGESAFSEPESRNVRSLYQVLKPRLASYLAVHSHAEVLLLPWSYSEDTDPSPSDMPANIVQLRAVGQKMLEGLRSLGENYTMGIPMQTIGYAASGTSLDWALREKPGLYAYGFELRPPIDVNGGFILPPRHIGPTGQELLASLLALADGLRH